MTKTFSLSALCILLSYFTINSYTQNLVENRTSIKNIPVLNFKSLEPLLQQKTDTTYVINFWATWCKPCIEELPVFETLNKEYASQKIKVILVSLDLPENIHSALIPFIQKYNLQSTIVLLDDPDFNSWIDKVSTTWSGSIPATIIYNNQKRQFYEQSFNYNTLTQELASFIH